MFPKISDLLNFLFDIHLNLPFQTYGFMLTLGFLSGGLVLRSELKRKEREGLLAARIRQTESFRNGFWFKNLLQGIIVLVIIWKIAGVIIHYQRFASNPQKFVFSAEGSIPALVVAGIIYLAVSLYRYIVSKNLPEGIKDEIVHPYQHTWSILIVALVSALVGSKLFDVFDNFGSFLKNPVLSLTSFDGFAFYGGLIATVFILVLYMRVLRLDWKQVIDCTAPVILLGYAIGRLGCHLSGDGCWGVINSYPQPEWLAWLPDWLWACTYPHNAINSGIPIPGCGGPHCRMLAEPVFPTSLYESVLSLFSFCILWLSRRRIKSPVVLFGLFLVLFGSARMLIEHIRINNKYQVLGMQFSQAEIISGFLIIAGMVTIFFFRSRYRAGITK